MPEQSKLITALNEISKNLKEQTTVSAVNFLYRQIELKELVAKRKKLISIHSSYRGGENYDSDKLEEAHCELRNFDDTHPLILKFITLSEH